jgi:hypothetical protein
MVTDLANALQVRFLFYERSEIKGQCHEFMETVARDMVTDLANALQVRLLLSEIRYKRTVSRVYGDIGKGHGHRLGQCLAGKAPFV